MKKFFMMFASVLVVSQAMSAQLVSATPDPLFQSSENIVITYRPNDENSNKGLANLPSSTDIYAHIGVNIAGGGSWQYAPNWGNNAEKYKLKYVAPNTYELSIGNLKDYFGLRDNEKVEKIAMVFRTGDTKKEGKTADGGDIFMDVTPDGLSVTCGNEIVVPGGTITITAYSSPAAPLTISVNGTTVATSTGAVNKFEHKYKTPTVGNYKIIVSDGKNTAETNLIVHNLMEADYPGGKPVMGAVDNGDGSVTFCLAAPQKKYVKIIGSWDGDDFNEDAAALMNYCDYQGNRYFWTTVKGIDPEKQYIYYYIVDNTYRVADPYSKLVLDRQNDSYLTSVWKEGSMTLPSIPAKVNADCSHLSVYQGNMNVYEWSDFKIPDHSGLYIYELLLRDFTGTEGQAKGDGTLRKAKEKIPYLKQLGINAVELMPIMEFNGNLSWGYNTNFYFAPDKAYGNPIEYKDFIDECHKNGIAVILDIVFNQSDGAHPWYRMYPVASNPFYNQTAPHDYSVLNDWRQENPLVQQQWEDCLRYWLREYNVDGFRFDLVKGLGDSNSYGSGTEAVNQSRIANMKRFHSIIKSEKENAIQINEFLGSASEEKEYAADGHLVWANYNDNSRNFVKGVSGGSLIQLDGSGSACPWRNRITYTESHDEQRIAYDAITNGVSGIKNNQEAVANRLGSLAAQHLMSPGPKMIWQFQELGASQNTKNSNWSNNTDNKTVIWSNLNNDNFKTLHEIYVALGAIRKNNPELFVNDGVLTKINLDGAYSQTRGMVLTSGDKEIAVFINPATNGAAAHVAVETHLLNTNNADLIIASKGAAPTLSPFGLKMAVNLAPNSFAIFATKTVNGIQDTVVGDADSSLFEVYGSDGEIIIVGEYKNAEVFNLNGLSMGRLNGLNRGIYMVRVDGETFKVVVQ